MDNFEITKRLHKIYNEIQVFFSKGKERTVDQYEGILSEIEDLVNNL